MHFPGDGRIILDDSETENDVTNGHDELPAKKQKRQYPVDLPLDIVLGKMPQKVCINTYRQSSMEPPIY